jgi:hypothetical protein
MNIFSKFICIFFLFFSSPLVFSQASAPNYPKSGIMSKDVNSFIDEDIDYSNFSGRVSDKHQSELIFKVKVENNNTKFFRAGDNVYFTVNLKATDRECKAYVKSVEEFYFIIEVQDLSLCYHEDNYFRRGTVLNFRAPILAQRVFEASKYREMLLVRKEDFMKQLNEINNFIWGFDQEKVKSIADFDDRINKLQLEKRRALDNLILKKQESLVLQNELMRKLNSLDESLKYYKVERQELYSDRWNLDHHLTNPVGQRPLEIKRP